MNAAAAPQAATTPILEVRQQISELLRACNAAATAYERPDLAERIAKAQARHSDRELTVLVAGEFKQGKSTLVNAVLNMTVCGVADDVSTAVPTFVRNGAEPTATVHYRADADGNTREPLQIPLTEVAALGTEQGNPGNREGIQSIDVAIPRKLLEPGLTIVDTPGVGGLDSAHGAVTLSALSVAELVVFVSDASQPLTASEVDFLRAAFEQSAHVVLVQPKIDIHPSWRAVVASNREIIEQQGLSVDIIPVSSTLRQRAAAENSAALNNESGFPKLMAVLRDAGTGETAKTLARATLADATFVIDQLRSSFESEQSTLDDPDAAAEIVKGLELAKERADRLRSQSAKWQQTLNDGVQDVSSDMDHDLRLRMRSLIAEAEAAIDADDPADRWDELEEWLHRRLGFDLAGHFQAIADRANELADDVAQHFMEDEAELDVELNLAFPQISSRLLSDELTLNRDGLSGNALAAVRGSYGGLLMFGMAGQMVGLAMLNPLSILVGLGLGRRGLREEKKRALVQRQQQAKMTIRKYVDDINLETSKSSRDAIRRAQRELRDEFASRAEQLQSTIRESLKTAEQSTKQAVGERQERLTHVRAELGRVMLLHNRAAEIATAIGSSTEPNAKGAAS